MLTIAVACDSGNSCRLHEAMIGHFRPSDITLRIADNRNKAPVSALVRMADCLAFLSPIFCLRQPMRVSLYTASLKFGTPAPKYY